MRADGCEQACAASIPNAELRAGGTDNLRDARVMNVANVGKEVMLDLEIESTHVPSQKTIVWREVDRGVNLMDRPWARQPLDGWKLCFLDAMSELEYGAQHNAEHHGCAQVE